MISSFFKPLSSIPLLFWTCLSSQSSFFGGSLSRWIFMQFESGSVKVGPLSEWSCYSTGSPCFPISWTHATVAFDWTAPSFAHPLLWLSVHASLEWIICFQFITATSLSHVHLQLISFHVTSWHFVLTWLLSLSLIRRGIMRRSCVHDTGFCDCAGVGVSGAV